MELRTVRLLRKCLGLGNIACSASSSLRTKEYTLSTRMGSETLKESTEVGLIRLPVTVKQTHVQILYNIAQYGNLSSNQEFDLHQPKRSLHNRREGRLLAEHLEEIALEQPIQLRLMVGDEERATIRNPKPLPVTSMSPTNS